MSCSLLDLPQEVICSISYYLSLNDILSCCLVSSKLRDLFNDDIIWFRLCSYESPKLDQFNFIQEPSVVPNKFKSLNLKYQTLKPICKWRERFMQEFHIVKNIYNSKFTSYDLKKHKVSQYDAGEDNFDKHYNIQCYQNFIVVPFEPHDGSYENSDDSDSNSDQDSLHNSNLRIIKIFQIPEEKTRKLKLVRKMNYPLKIKCNYVNLFENILVLVQSNLVQIYKFEENSLMFFKTFLFNFSDLSIEIPKMNIHKWYKAKFKNFLKSCAQHNKKYFVGCSYTLPINTVDLHIWDIESCTKVCVKTLNLVYPANFIKLDVIKNFLFVTMESSSTCTIHRFEFNSMSFSDFTITIDKELYKENQKVSLRFCHNYVIQFSDDFEGIHFWNHSNGEFVCYFSCQGKIIPKSINISHNHLLYIDFKLCKDEIRGGNKKNYQVGRVNLSSLDHIYLEDNFYGIKTTKAIMISDNIILISNKYCTFIYDMREKAYEERTWRKYDFKHILSYPNKSKLIVRYDEEDPYGEDSGECDIVRNWTLINFW